VTYCFIYGTCVLNAVDVIIGIAESKKVTLIQARGNKINADKTLSACKIPATSEFPVPGSHSDER